MFTWPYHGVTVHWPLKITASLMSHSQREVVNFVTICFRSHAKNQTALNSNFHLQFYHSTGFDSNLPNNSKGVGMFTKWKRWQMSSVGSWVAFMFLFLRIILNLLWIWHRSAWGISMEPFNRLWIALGSLDFHNTLQFVKKSGTIDNLE